MSGINEMELSRAVTENSRFNLTVSNLNEWVIDWLSKTLEKDRSEISIGSSFSDFGMDSVKCLEMANDLEEATGCEIDPTIAWEAPTVAELVKIVCEQSNSVSINTEEKGEVGDEISDEELLALLSE